MALSRSKPGPKALRDKFRQIRLLVCDVDGVLTDGGLYISESGESKRFFVPDGLALRGWQMSGLQVAWISARASMVTKKRARELKTDFLIQTKNDKVPALEKILTQTGLEWAEVAFIGDDLVDLAVMAKVGVAVAPGTACTEARAIAHYVTRAGGGNGAVRELIEKILKAQGKWSKLISEIAR